MKIQHIIAAVALIVTAGVANAQSYGGFGNGGVAQTPRGVEEMYARQAYNRDVNMRNTLNSHQPANWGNGLPANQVHTNAVQQRAQQAQQQAHLQGMQKAGAHITGTYVAPRR